SMLWKKKLKVSDAGPLAIARNEPDAGGTERALDVLATLLKLYGQFAFDTDDSDAAQIRGQCNQWATRISVGAPRETDDPESDGDGGRLVRDWPGLIGFWQEQRRSESDYVVRSLGSFREAIVCFADVLGRAFADEQRSDRLLNGQLESLSRALTTRDIALICNEAQQVVASVRKSISSRQEREVAQVRVLSERLRVVREELAETRRKAEMDALTQLSNRAAFDAHSARLASLRVLLGEAPCLILADVDHFKSINDRYGHPGGDEVLRQLSHCLSRTFLRKNDFVARYGGEEFAILLIDTTRSQAEMLCRRLGDNVRGLSVWHEGQEIRMTISAGLAVLGPGESSGSWLERADAALYRAKRAGRDRYELA
ncbi:MAG TPA: GGDEF domain-containing protein, partial [Polyangiaceae bacterium]|nr:GGDEF domain-containing protein [Polyangiaceae bacterium]